MTVTATEFQNQELLIAAVHLGSKAFYGPIHQDSEITLLARELVDLENKHGHFRTMIIGDFNTNPFEPGMVKAAGFTP